MFDSLNQLDEVTPNTNKKKFGVIKFMHYKSSKVQKYQADQLTNFRKTIF